MERCFRPFGALATVLAFLLTGVLSGPANAAVMTFTSTRTFSNPPLSDPSSPVALNFSFPGLLINIENITISGTFAASNGWDYYEKLAFSAGAAGPVGTSYYYWYLGPTEHVYNFTVSLFKPLSLTGDVYPAVPSGDPEALKAYLISELGSAGAVSLYFQPQPFQVYGWDSHFALQSATLTVVGEDPPAPVANMPIPGGALLLISGIAMLMFGARIGRHGT